MNNHESSAYCSDTSHMHSNLGMLKIIGNVKQ